MTVFAGGTIVGLTAAQTAAVEAAFRGTPPSWHDGMCTRVATLLIGPGPWLNATVDGIVMNVLAEHGFVTPQSAVSYLFTDHIGSFFGAGKLAADMQIIWKAIFVLYKGSGLLTASCTMPNMNGAAALAGAGGMRITIGPSIPSGH